MIDILSQEEILLSCQIIKKEVKKGQVILSLSSRNSLKNVPLGKVKSMLCLMGKFLKKSSIFNIKNNELSDDKKLEKSFFYTPYNLSWRSPQEPTIISEMPFGMPEFDTKKIKLSAEKMLQICQKNLSLPAEIDVNFSVSWVQKMKGNLSLTLNLRDATQGYLGSYFGEQLESQWLLPGQILGRTGYWVTSSSLHKIGEAKIAHQGLLPEVKIEKPLATNEKIFGDDQKEKTYRLGLYRPTLSVGYEATQKRKEAGKIILDLGGHGFPLSYHYHLTLPERDPHQPWKKHFHYREDEHVSFNGFIFRCVTEHVSGDFFHKISWEKVGALDEFDRTNRRDIFLPTDEGEELTAFILERSLLDLCRYPSDKILEVDLSLEDGMQLLGNHWVQMEDDLYEIEDVKISVDGTTKRIIVQAVLYAWSTQRQKFFNLWKKTQKDGPKNYGDDDLFMNDVMEVDPQRLFRWPSTSSAFFQPSCLQAFFEQPPLEPSVSGKKEEHMQWAPVLKIKLTSLKKRPTLHQKYEKRVVLEKNMER
ncbi:hypothetical protein OAN22_00295 [Alphaproteobacteria bacterium]|nr:hypothetical protein [Alphaproteobacteria bacterium]